MEMALKTKKRNCWMERKLDEENSNHEINYNIKMKVTKIMMIRMKKAVMMLTTTMKMMTVMRITKFKRVTEQVIKTRLTMTKLWMIKRTKTVIIYLISVVARMLRFNEFYYYKN